MPVGSDSVSNGKDTYCIRVGPMADSHLTTSRLKGPPPTESSVLLLGMSCWHL